MSNEKFYFNQAEPNRSCFLAMRDILLTINHDISETTKYGMPCFCFKGKQFCYLWMDKKSNDPYFLLVDGNKLNHPELQSDDRKRMKIFSVDPNEDLPLKTIYNILEEARELY